MVVGMIVIVVVGFVVFRLGGFAWGSVVVVVVGFVVGFVTGFELPLLKIKTGFLVGVAVSFFVGR